MDRINNITYKFDGEYVDAKEFMKLLCESINLIIESSNIKKA